MSLRAYRSGVATSEDPGTPFELARRRMVGLVTGNSIKYKFRIAFGGGIWATYDELPRDRQRDLLAYLSMAAMTELGLWRDTEEDRDAIEDRELEQLESDMSPTMRAAMKAVLAEYRPS